MINLLNFIYRNKYNLIEKKYIINIYVFDIMILSIICQFLMRFPDQLIEYRTAYIIQMIDVLNIFITL